VRYFSFIMRATAQGLLVTTFTASLIGACAASSPSDGGSGHADPLTTSSSVGGASTGGGGTAGTGGSGGSGGSGGGAGGAVAASSSSTGMPGACSTKADCAALDGTCAAGNCVNGKCELAPANEGAACDDGLFCTDNDVCQMGQCVAGTPKFCPSPDACHVGSCDEQGKACVGSPGNDGAPCDDGDPCTSSGTCSSGVCMKGQLVDCSAFSTACAIGYCDPVLGCIAKPKNDGVSCDDGLFCTIQDKCVMGACQGVPNPCANPIDAVCMIGSCNEAQKSCSAVPGPDGAACDDANPCTKSEACSAGACSGGVPTNAGGACDDLDPCTQASSCDANGKCVGSSPILQCVGGDKCCPAGCSMAADSDCSLLSLRFDGNDGSNQFVDSSPQHWSVSPVGAAHVATAEHAPGSTSSLSAQGGRVHLPSDVAFTFSGAFAIDAWIRPADYQNSVIFSAVSANFGIPTEYQFYLDWNDYGGIPDGTLNFYMGVRGSNRVNLYTEETIPLNQWSRVRVERDANNMWTMSINGVSKPYKVYLENVAMFDPAMTVGNPQLDFNVGGDTFGISNRGYVDDLVVTTN